MSLLDKAEYRIASEHIKKLIAQGEYAEASRIADTIDWRRVKSVMMLCTVSDLYKVNRRYEDARELLYIAYERNPGSRTILYSLCDLCIKLEEFVAAIEYYKSFVQVAPRDSGRFVLQYRLYQAQDVSIEERIEVLEQLKAEEYTEKWAYELAYLYHRIGFSTKCVEECDDLILWFGKGRYVYKAMELKMLHEALTPSQQKVYNARFDNVERAKDMTRVLPRIDSGENEMTDESMVDVTDAPTVEIPQEYIEQELMPNVEDIQVKTLDVTSTYNTVNLQKELADSLRELLEQTPDENTPVEVSIEEAEGQYAFVDLEPVDVFLEETPVEEPAEEVVEPEKQITGQISIEDVMQSITEEFEAEMRKELFDYEVAMEEEVAEVEPELEFDEVVYEPEVEELVQEIEEESIDEPVEESVEVITEDVVEEVIEEVAEDDETGEVDPMPEEEELETVKNRVDLYEDFVRVPETEEQINNALEIVSMVAGKGNVLVTGHDLRVCFDFIKAFVLNLKQRDFLLKGKTAKISSVNLNKKNPADVLDKVKGGLLIIERAGRLREETVEALKEYIQNSEDEMLVFMTDTEIGMNRFVERHPDFAESFEARVDIKEYSGDALVEYGMKYAYENEYSLDVMGKMELQTIVQVRLDNDEALEKADIEYIMQAAMDNADKNSFKHFIDVLLRQRYDDEDMIIIHAEDFVNVYNQGYTE